MNFCSKNYFISPFINSDSGDIVESVVCKIRHLCPLTFSEHIVQKYLRAFPKNNPVLVQPGIILDPPGKFGEEKTFGLVFFQIKKVQVKFILFINDGIAYQI